MKSVPPSIVLLVGSLWAHERFSAPVRSLRNSGPANAEHFVLPGREDPSDFSGAFYRLPYAPCLSVAQINHTFSDCGQL